MSDTHPRRWQVLLLVSLAELLGMSLWFTASAVAPQLQSLWGLSASQAGFLTTVVQIGFVAGTDMAASGLCCLIIGFFFGLNLWLVGAIAWIWGFFIVADSAQFSALVTEVAPRHAVGTALTLQTSMGFLLTSVTIQLVPLLEKAVGWPWAFPILALGPAVGIQTIRRLRADASPAKA